MTSPTISATCYLVDQLVPSPLQVQQSRYLDVPQDVVFTIVTDPYQAIGQQPHLATVYLPQKRTWLDDPIGTQRIYRFPSGAESVQTITHWDEDNGVFAYSLAEPNMLGLHNHLTLVICEAIGDGTLVHWLQYFEHDDVTIVLPLLEYATEAALDQLEACFAWAMKG